MEYFEPMLIAPNRGLSLNTKAILPWANPKTFARYEEALTALGKRFGFTLSTPLSAYSPEALQALFYGEDDPSQKSKSGLRRNRLGGSVALESPEYDDNAPAPVKAYDGPYKLATDCLLYTSFTPPGWPALREAFEFHPFFSSFPEVRKSTSREPRRGHTFRE